MFIGFCKQFFGQCFHFATVNTVHNIFWEKLNYFFNSNQNNVYKFLNLRIVNKKVTT